MGRGASFDSKSNFYSQKPRIEPYKAMGKADSEKSEDSEANEIKDSIVNNSNRLTPEEKEIIQTEFNKLAKDQVIGKRKIMEYFGLDEIANTVLATAMLAAMKSTSGKQKNLVDYDKFSTFAAIMHNGTLDERLGLLFNLFNPGSSKHISKKKLKRAIGSIFQSLMQINYKDNNIEQLKQSLFNYNDSHFESALDLLVEEIFEAYGSKENPDNLNLEQWKKWICDLKGMKEILSATEESKVPESEAKEFKEEEKISKVSFEENKRESQESHETPLQNNLRESNISLEEKNEHSITFSHDLKNQNNSSSKVKDKDKKH